ncbi:MAG: S1 family peptidase [Bifidobacteriaceae bacterium]|jgi:hypothetical protein|nr:S1 family peptidase [Bifidobacteriaceae bacterium]
MAAGGLAAVLTLLVVVTGSQGSDDDGQGSGGVPGEAEKLALAQAQEDSSGGDGAAVGGSASEQEGGAGTTSGQDESPAVVVRAGPSEFFPQDSECLTFDVNGQPLISGEETSETIALVDALGSLAQANPDVAAGVSYCSDRTGAVVFVAGEAPEFRAEVQAIAAEHSSLNVFTQDVAAGFAAAEAAAQKLHESEFGNSITLLAVDIVTGGIDAWVDPAALAEGSVTAEVLHAYLLATESVDLPVAVQPMGPYTTAVDRKHDTAPYWMGAEIVTTYQSTTGYCSTGLTIVTGTSRRLLTAGHCLGSTFTNNGNTVGTISTTAYNPTNSLSNSDIYGDWKLLQGQTYGSRVYSGPVTGTGSGTSLAITAADWDGLERGRGVCTSGRSTGQVCRFFVTHTSACGWDDNSVYNCHLMVMRHDSSGGNGADTAGFSGGDSGGPCYHANSSGVTAVGIVTGSAGTVYLCTKLSGVRAWSASATVG